MEKYMEEDRDMERGREAHRNISAASEGTPDTVSMTQQCPRYAHVLDSFSWDKYVTAPP
jgi:hypothetical protein